jgi:hypothetical protein
MSWHLEAKLISTMIKMLASYEPQLKTLVAQQLSKQVMNTHKVNQQDSNKMDMRFYWIRDCFKPKQFIVHWNQ